MTARETNLIEPASSRCGRSTRDWCPGEDSNLHDLHHWYLKPARYQFRHLGTRRACKGPARGCQLAQKREGQAGEARRASVFPPSIRLHASPSRFRLDFPPGRDQRRRMRNNLRRDSEVEFAPTRARRMGGHGYARTRDLFDLKIHVARGLGIGIHSDAEPGFCPSSQSESEDHVTEGILGNQGQLKPFEAS